MPLYEYRCRACDGQFEVIQKLGDPPPESCRSCGDGPVDKLISAPAFQFKGTGWYITDYARQDGGKSDKKDDGTTKSDAGDGKPKSGDKATSGSSGSSSTADAKPSGGSGEDGGSKKASASSSAAA